MSQSSRLVTSRWLQKLVGRETPVPASELPVYLCPAVGSNQTTFSTLPVKRRRTTAHVRCGHHCMSATRPRALHTQAAAPHAVVQRPPSEQQGARGLPLQCSGCGALSQSTDSRLPGYFDLGRRAVRQYLGLLNEEVRPRKESKLLQEALRSVDVGKMEQMGVRVASLLPSRESGALDSRSKTQKEPLCDRCHELIHHHTGNPVFHPSLQSLKETLDESPHKRNHVYHVLDAADFPMSLVPQVNQILEMAPLRSRNRRSRRETFQKGRRMEISFIITRSDLLAPKKEQVDSLMPYLRETLRLALGRRAREVRLGNVRCVSAKRGWWTKTLKEDIWERGGAGWMLGKVNVGKSQLFEAVFPRGRMNWKPEGSDITVALDVRGRPVEDPLPTAPNHDVGRDDPDLESLDEFSLLPPVRPETEFPAMPIVSSLPGTTASPIRVPFGNGKGELIDLPGLSRGDLEVFVKKEDRPSLVMKSRVTPEQQVLKPGRSLLLGGLIRITPRTPDLIFLAYAFTPIKPHLTATDKAVRIQEQTEDAPDVESIALPGVGEKIKHARSFQLRYDVTKKRAGPLTRRDSVNLKVDRLPFRVLAIDILIEGCGWVEVVAQVRAKDLEKPQSSDQMEHVTQPRNSNPERLQTLDLFGDLEDDLPAKNEPKVSLQEPNWPVIDVYSPEGRFIGSRPPINGWLMNKPRTATKSRPRRSMKGVKKEVKRARRQSSAAW